VQQLVTTHSLELTTFDHLETAPSAPARYELQRVEIACPVLNRFLYASVGADWIWYERLIWSYQQWREYLERSDVGTWIAYVEGTPAGYFELEKQAGGRVEIAYFGLLPQFIGQGIGSALLRDAVLTAREFGGERVWLHTCSLDHPSALANYQARGFTIFDRTEAYKEVPDEPLQPWPGAYPSQI
jgi:ribosomal protein S18 acetylase RimI-like enzyme